MTWEERTKNALNTVNSIAHNPHGVKRIRVRNNSPPRQQPITRLEPNNTRISSRQSYGSSRIGPQSPVSHQHHLSQDMSLVTYAQHCPVATATALPPELPPALNCSPCPSLFREYFTGPKAECVECEPMPNSSIFVFPAIIAPASRSCLTTVASYGLVKALRLSDAAVVGRSVVHILSFMPISRPLRLRVGRPRRDLWTVSARARSWPRSWSDMKALREPYLDWLDICCLAWWRVAMEGKRHRNCVWRGELRCGPS